MRPSLEARLQNVWYGGEDPPLALRALVPVYRSLTRLDRWRQQRKKPERPEDCCIIVVGNLTAGGSGKTPLVIHLAELFQSQRLKTGVISRGYGRQGRGLVQVDSNSPAKTAGDEPLMIARRSGVPVAVCENRLKALIRYANRAARLSFRTTAFSITACRGTSKSAWSVAPMGSAIDNCCRPVRCAKNLHAWKRLISSFVPAIARPRFPSPVRAWTWYPSCCTRSTAARHGVCLSMRAAR